MDRPATTGGGTDVLVGRPRILDRLLAGGARRVTVVTAGAGYGKSSLARQWLGPRRHAWLALTDRERSIDGFARGWSGALAGAGIGMGDADDRARLVIAGREAADDDDRAETVAELLAGALAAELGPGSELPVVLDDLHELGDGPGARVVSGLVRRLPRSVPLLIASRVAVPFPMERLRATGDLVEVRRDELAFEVPELEAILDGAFGADARAMALPIFELTSGWPAAVRLVIDGLRVVPPPERSDWVAARRPARALFDYLAEEVLAHEAPDAIELIRVLAPHDIADLELCAALGLADASSTVADLERRGMFIARRADGLFALHDLVRSFARERLPLDEDRRRDGTLAAVAWHERRDDPERALRLAIASGDAGLVEGRVIRYAPRLLAAGRVDAILEAGVGGGVVRSRVFDLAVADALAYRGRATEAVAILERCVPVGTDAPAAVAWRMARLHLLQGEVGRAASAVHEVGLSGDDADDALVLAHVALTRFFGATGQAVDPALRAVELADRQADPTARSIAHMAAAYTLRETDRIAAHAHHRLALTAAEQAGDVVQIVRLRNADDDGPLDEQYEAATESLALIEAGGHPAWLANCLLNRGIIGLDLGRFEASEADFERARVIVARNGPVAELLSLAFLAELGRIRGSVAPALQQFQRVVELADAVGDANVSSYARAGLARLVARTDPERARLEVARAVQDTAPVHLQDMLLAEAWIAAVQDRPDDARRLARDVMTRAGSIPGRAAALASATEVEALVALDARERDARLADALAIWEGLGNEAAAAMTRLAIATFSDGADSRAAARAREGMEANGIRASGAEGAGLLALIPAATASPITVRVLGGLAVARDGRPVAVGEWKSRKARDLLKILVLRRGSPATRDELAELLWPDDAGDASGNRLSVAVSILRAVLDPQRAFASDRFVTGGRDAVALRTADLRIDLADFLADARAGLEALARGDRADAATLLTAAEARYAGDVLPEDAYADWAVHAREEARSTYGQVLQVLAGLASDRGNHDDAARYLMRAIGNDAYDEPAHLALVRTLADGRHHGEARRAYQAYVRRMAELEIEPASYPD